MAQQELSITRVINYPRHIVFAAWTNRSQLLKWFAPRGCSILASKLDLREGGQFHWCIRNPKYPDCWCTGEFIIIKSPSIIQYKIRLSDENGNPVSSADALKANDWPEETIVTVTFNERDSITEVTIRQSVSEMLAKKTGAYHGWTEMLDILEEKLSSSQIHSNI